MSNEGVGSSVESRSQESLGKQPGPPKYLHFFAFVPLFWGQRQRKGVLWGSRNHQHVFVLGAGWVKVVAGRNKISFGFRTFF